MVSCVRQNVAVMLAVICVVAGCGGPPASDESAAVAGREAIPPPVAEPPSPHPPQQAAPAGSGPGPSSSPAEGERRLSDLAASDFPAEPMPGSDVPPDAMSASDIPADATPDSSAPGLAKHEVPDSAAVWLPEVRRVEIDEARAAAAGIGKLSGRRLVLYTDLPIDEEIAALPAAFDQAFPQWCRYFGVDESEHADWQMTGFLMQEKPRFEQLGLLPDELPPFENGFSRNFELWLYEQPSAYYRRHLVLHEGTHGFMNTVLRSCGPPWYMEGIAELLATHAWKDGKLTLNYMPRNREEVPMWGRIRMIDDDFTAGRALTLASVLGYRPGDFTAVEPYAWCWAAAAMLDRHPRYQERFRQMTEWVLDPHFTDRFLKLIGDDWPDLAEQWQVFIAELEYGMEVPAAAVEFLAGEPPPAEGVELTIEAAAGWQSSRVWLEAGRSYRIAAEGRYQVADVPQIWWSEPNGVSIRYYRGRPLGMLLGAVRAAPSAVPTAGDKISGLLRPIAIGLENTFAPDRTGTLYLKINDSAAELSDNAGQVRVRIVPEPLRPEALGNP